MLVHWLLALVVLSGMLAVVLLLFPTTALFEAYNATYARAFWDAQALPPQALRQHHFSMGVVGAGVLGWAINLFWVVHGPLRRGERWAWNCVASSVAAWVVLDVAVSAVFQVWGELLFVSLAAVGFAPPLLLLRRELAVRS